MKNLLRTARFRLAYMELPGLLGLGLLLIVSAVATLIFLPGLHHLHQLQRDVSQMRLTMKQHHGQWIDHSPQASLNTFYRLLPAEADAAKQVATIFTVAYDDGMDLDKVEYVLSRDRAANLSRYQMILPLHGTYTDIRYFVIDVLNALPTAAVNELSFRRDDSHKADVDARLRITLYLKRE